MYLLGVVFEARPQAGPRYVLPVAGFLPLLVILIFQRLSHAKWWPVQKINLEKYLIIIPVLGISFNIFFTQSMFAFDDDILYKPSTQELFMWVKENLGPDDHYIFRKCRALALMTGRMGVFLPKEENNVQNLIKEMEDNEIHYCILSKQHDGILLKMLEQNLPKVLQSIWENREYRIYKRKSNPLIDE